MAPRDRCLPARFLPRHPAFADAHDAYALGPHHQYGFGGRGDGNRGQANYAAAKAGLIGATRSLAIEMASRGVTVNAVAPGVIESPMTAQAFPAERIRQIVPAGRAGTPEEVAGMVAYLASDAAAYVTGQVLSVNGGMA